MQISGDVHVQGVYLSSNTCVNPFPFTGMQMSGDIRVHCLYATSL